ncbi:MAG: hypothetical protein K0B85_06770 [Coriobacteriia bacterium]|nr:hypothetical protein [Coriobacteriia bacterium]
MSTLPRAPKIALVVTVAVLVVAVTTAWCLQVRAEREDVAQRYVIVVERAEDALCVLSLDELQALESRRVVMQGQRQEGPPLLSVLESCGVVEFESVEVFGMGVRDDGYIRLGREEIDEDVLLDFAIRGTTKLCGPDIPWERRVRDVERIVVR